MRSPEFEQHDVTRHELLGRDQAGLAAADGPRLCGKHVADRIQRLLGLALLEKPEQGVDDHDTQDDRSVEPQTDHQLYKAGAEQDIDQDIVELGRRTASAGPAVLPSGRRLGPYWVSRRDASLASSPVAGSVFSRPMT